MEEFDFEAAMEEPAKTARVVEDPDPLIGHEIILPEGTDIAPTALSLVPFEEKVKILVARAKEIQITDLASRKEAADVGLIGKKLRQKVETIKKSPNYLAAEKFVKDIRHLCKLLTDPLQMGVENVIKTKLAAYEKEQILEQQRREAAAREDQRRRQAQLDEEARQIKAKAEARARAAADELAAREAVGDLDLAESTALKKTIEEETQAAQDAVAPIVAVVVTDKPSSVVHSEQGSAYTRRKPVARLVDASLVDDKYKIIDMKLVQRDVDAGERNIPGFVIEDEIIPVLRG